MPKSENGLLNVREVARFFGGVCPHTIYLWVRKGKFPRPIKIGRLSRWRKEDCERLLQEMSEREV